MSYLTAFPHLSLLHRPLPLSLWPERYGIPLSYLILGIGSELYLLTRHTRESWKPIQKFLRQRDCSKLYKMTERQCLSF